MDSSRTSFSSSFTSFSSLEHKSPEEEPKPRSVDINQSPPAFKDIIKESIHKDFRKASTEGEGRKKNKVLKPVDSPRPMDLLKFKELDESLRILMKLQESSWKFYEEESPRLSCDGRKILQSFIDSKQTAKLRERPRLSLDSKEGLANKELDKVAIRRSAASDQLHHPEANESNPSIVAKLMGLEPINSAAQSGVRCCDPFFNAQKNKTAAPENKHNNPSKALRNSKELLESSSVLSDGDTPKTALGYVEANVKKKIGTVYSGMEGMQKLQYQHSNKEIQDLKRAILESRKKCNWKLSSVNSLIHKSNEDLKSPIVVMEPASTSALSFCPVTKRERPPTLGKIRTSNSTNRKKDLLNFQTDGEQTTREKKANRRSPYPLSKEQSERAVNNTISPQLQQMKKDYPPTPYDSKKFRRQTANSQSSDSVSPRGKIRHLCKAKDDELLISGNKVNVEAMQTSSSTEGRSDFFEQNIQSPSVKVGTRAASISENKIHPMILKNLSAKELDMVPTEQWSPNSVLDASLKHDDLPHSQVSVSNAFKELQNLSPDHSLNTAYQSPTLSSTSSSGTDSHKPESMDTIIVIPSSRTKDELSMNNATLFTLGNHGQENPFEAEAFLESGLLLKELDLISTLRQTNSDKPSESSEKSNTKKLHQKLFFDVVNEILARRMEAFSSGGQHDHMLQSKFFRIKHLNKDLCTEIKCLENSKDLDDNSILRNDLLRQSQAWDASESEVPVIVLEIERLIFKDLINEVVGGSAVVLEANRRRHRRQLLAKSGI